MAEICEVIVFIALLLCGIANITEGICDRKTKRLIFGLACLILAFLLIKDLYDAHYINEQNLFIDNSVVLIEK